MTEEDDAVLIQRLVSDILSDDNRSLPGRDPIGQIGESLFDRLSNEACKFSGSCVEQAIVMTKDGKIVQQRVGGTNIVAVIPAPDTITAHNHPGNSPPSQEDVELMIDTPFSFLLIVTPSGTTYHVAPADSAVPDLRIHLNRLREISTAVALRTRARFAMKISDEELHCRQMHAVYSELARKEMLCYGRFEWKKTLHLMKKRDSDDSKG